MTLSLLFLALLLASCSYTGLATVTASNDMQCPEDKIVVTNTAKRTYRAVGCGKEQTYYCDYMGQEVVCRSLQQVVEARRRAEDNADSCGGACDRAEQSCSEGCQNDECRSMCKSMGTGCSEGCGFTVTPH